MSSYEGDQQGFTLKNQYSPPPSSHKDQPTPMHYPNILFVYYSSYDQHWQHYNILHTEIVYI